MVATLGALRGWRAFLASGLLGMLSATALPPVHLIPALLVAIPGLLVLIGGQRRARGAAAVGFWFGFGQHLLGLYWITEAIMLEAARFWWLVPLAVPLLAAGMSIFVAIPCACVWLFRPGWARVLALAGAWVLADMLRQFVATGFPWNPLGSAWAVPGAIGDTMIQPASLVGVHGLTLVTLALAATPALGSRRAMAGAAGALALWASFGVWRLSTPPPPPTDLTVVLVQGNVAEGQKHDRAFAVETFERYLRLTQEGIAAAHRPAVAIWPETSSPFLLDRDANARAAIAQAAQGTPVIAGAVRFDEQNRPRNSLMAIVNAGLPAAVYDKWHLVPFGEYQPSWALLPIQIVPGGGFAAGSGPQTIAVPGLPPFGAMICYEVIFPGQVVEAANRPAWLVNITNDAWFGNSTGPRQHLAAARMRAVEEGLPLMRAANTGISVAFDGFGREQGRIGMNVAGTLNVVLPGVLASTWFAKLGLAIPALMGSASLVGALLVSRTERAL